MEGDEVDAVVVGAGFAGLYALYKFRDELQMSVRAYEAGSGVGGTWFWNRYPGARCDSVSYVYCYSFSPELAQEWEWSGRYPEQPEIERYLNHVADRFDLRREIQFSTRVVSATFDDDSRRWEVRTDRGDTVTAQFLVTAVGCLSVPTMPEISGLEDFEGDAYQTSMWPHEGVDFTGKRVGLIGTGASGTQAAPLLARQAKHLTVFQRTPNYSTPARHRPFLPGEQADIKANYDEIFALTRQQPAGFPAPPLDRPMNSVSPEQRREILDECWSEGGFKLLWGGFSDFFLPENNEVHCEFIRSKIREIVRDPETAELLCPNYSLGAKRPPLDTDYYETFNRDNVTLVDVRTAPITSMLPNGLATTAAEYELDAVVFATGFDAITGALSRIDIQGRNGVKLADVWSSGPRSMLGIAVAGFPNLFTITGPGSPGLLVNVPTSIEHHVNWIGELIRHMRTHGWTQVEPTEGAQDAWTQHVAELGQHSLSWQVSSYYVGGNIRGKPQVMLPYTGGQAMYRERSAAVVDAGYEGFAFDKVDEPLAS